MRSVAMFFRKILKSEQVNVVHVGGATINYFYKITHLAMKLCNLCMNQVKNTFFNLLSSAHMHICAHIYARDGKISDLSASKVNVECTFVLERSPNVHLLRLTFTFGGGFLPIMSQKMLSPCSFGTGRGGFIGDVPVFFGKNKINCYNPSQMGINVHQRSPEVL